MKIQNVAYKRVSSKDQNLDRQLVDMTFDREFIEKVSGRTTERPELVSMLEYVREGDIISVHSLDRLARSLSDLLTLVKSITSKGVRIKFIKENLEFGGDDDLHSTLMISILGAFAQFEVDLNKNRQSEGILQAQRRDRELLRENPNVSKFKLTYRGRKPFEAKVIARIHELAAEGVRSGLIAQELQISRSAVRKYRYKTKPIIPSEVSDLNQHKENKEE